MNMNEIVGRNIREFIKAKGKQNKWVIERTGMNSKTFYNLLDGKGNVAKHAETIANLFRINEVAYFYKTDFKPPLTFSEIKEKDDFIHYAALSYHNQGDKQEFLRTMEILDEFIEIIDVIQSALDNEELIYS